MLKYLILSILPLSCFANLDIVLPNKGYTFKLKTVACYDTIYETSLKSKLLHKFTTVSSQISNLDHICNSCFVDDHDKTNYELAVKENEEKQMVLTILDVGSRDYDKVEYYPMHQNPEHLAKAIAEDVSIFFEDLISKLSISPPPKSSHNWIGTNYFELKIALEKKIDQLKNNPNYFDRHEDKKAIIEYLIDDADEKFKKEFSRLMSARKDIIEEINSGNTELTPINRTV
ncbi:MAG: hypothetical protein AAF849_24105 [Bacteroidota bacterium]